MNICRSVIYGIVVTASLSTAPVDGAPAAKVLNAAAYYPEGPIWFHDKLYYVEYARNAIMTWDGSTNQVFSSQPGCGHSAVVPTAAGEFLVTCYDNGTIGRVTANGAVLPPYRHDKDGNAFVGPNDFAPDGRGGIYFTCSGSHTNTIDGKVFYLAPDGSISLTVDHINNANGLAVSKDGKRLYVVATDENRVLQFSIAAAGVVSDQREFVNLNALAHHATSIWPDGVKIDSRGQIYLGQSARATHVPYAGVIFIVNEHGKLLRSLTLPSLQVPNFAFSPDEKTLYVTAVDQIDQPPFLGKLYSIANR